MFNRGRDLFQFPVGSNLEIGIDHVIKNAIKLVFRCLDFFFGFFAFFYFFLNRFTGECFCFVGGYCLVPGQSQIFNQFTVTTRYLKETLDQVFQSTAGKR